MATRSNKVYEVSVGYDNKKEGDVPNWYSTTISARDAENAISKVKPKLGKGGYISSVVLIATLDE